MTLFLPNLAFEDELTGRPARPTADTARALDELSPMMALLGQPGDFVLVNDGMLPQEVPQAIQHVRFVERRNLLALLKERSTGSVVPWGWTAQAAAMAIQCGMSASDVPSLDAVRLVNSRVFNAAHDSVLCRSSDLLPFGSRAFGVICRNLNEWKKGVAHLERCGYARWVAKPQISHAGRNRLLCTGANLNSQQQGWLDKHLQHSDGIYLEPWVKPLQECGLQYHISRPERADKGRQNGLKGGSDDRSDDQADDGVILVGVSQLVNDQVGRYQGSLICTDGGWHDLSREAITHGFLVCRTARKMGYWGPLGIDCFQFLDHDGNLATRLCNDINGRFTMGRIALQLRSSLLPGQYGLLCQFAARDFQRFSCRIRMRLAENDGNDVDMIETSPSSISGRPVRSGTLLLTGPTAEELFQLIQRVKSE